jgi:hypothetical protein
MKTLRTRARAALLVGLAAFAVLQAGLNLSMDRWLPQLRDPPYAYKAARLRRRVLVPEKPLTVVVLGSSRTTCGLKGGDLEKCLAQTHSGPVVAFNFGMTGAGPLQQLLTLKRLLAEGVRPDLLVVEVLPPLFNGNLPQGEVKRLSATRLRAEELADVARFGGDPDGLRAAWWQAALLPWYTHRYAIISAVKPNLLPYQVRQDWFRQVDDSGWVESPFGPVSQERHQRALERARVEYTHYLTDYSLGGPACDALRELLGLCRDEGIATALLWMPEGPTFRSWYPPQALGQIDAFLTELSAKYDAPLINAREWVPEEDFADSHHLLLHGAARFTQRLGREALPPLLARRERAEVTDAAPP